MSENLRARLDRVAPRGGNRIISQLASTPQSRIHEAEVSRWIAGATLSADKMDRMLAALESLETLYDSYPVRVDMRDVANIRVALDRLAEKRAEELGELSAPPAVAPYRTNPICGVVAKAPEASKLLSEQLVNLLSE